MLDLSDKVPIGDVIYALEIVPAPLINDAGECCMFTVDVDGKRLMISADVPLEKRPICAALAAGLAASAEPTLIHVPDRGVVNCYS